MAYTADLHIDGGAAFGFSIVYQTHDGQPKDMTDAHAKLQVRTAPGGDLVLALADGEGITLGGVTGGVDVWMSASDTASLTQPRCVYDLLVDFGGGDRRRLLEGAVLVDPPVTVWELPEDEG